MGVRERVEYARAADAYDELSCGQLKHIACDAAGRKELEARRGGKMLVSEDCTYVTCSTNDLCSLRTGWPVRTIAWCTAAVQD